MQKRKVASANDQAEFINQMSQHNYIWIRRGALRSIDLEQMSRTQNKDLGARRMLAVRSFLSDEVDGAKQAFVAS